jgi:translation initiation factor 2B subunit (eIF-2B alpha/beta/delta family)
VLVYYPFAGVGTSMEILFAHQNHKPVFVANVSGKSVSPWLMYHSDIICESLDEAIEDVKDYSHYMELMDVI